METAYICLPERRPHSPFQTNYHCLHISCSYDSVDIAPPAGVHWLYETFKGNFTMCQMSWKCCFAALCYKKTCMPQKHATLLITPHSVTSKYEFSLQLSEVKCSLWTITEWKLTTTDSSQLMQAQQQARVVRVDVCQCRWVAGCLFLNVRVAKRTVCPKFQVYWFHRVWCEIWML